MTTKQGIQFDRIINAPVPGLIWPVPGQKWLRVFGYG